MATMLDQRSQTSLPMGYGYTSSIPQFKDPWASSNSMSNTQALYQSSVIPPVSQQHAARNDSISAPYSSDPHQQSKPIYANGYPSITGYAPTTNSIRYSPEHYQNTSSYAPYEQQVQRRGSYPIKPIHRDSYNDALVASEGLLDMAAQHDVTPRNQYPPRNGCQDAYGFPVAHSTHSSMSSASGYPQYYHGSYNGSIDGSVAGSSVTDYSSEAENAIAARSMSNAGHLGTNYHQEQASMMTQFNSKLSASAQKKHKCKICDKRFTRPSSLQTHMYSHTGEKPFACDFDGCGRHFSVVSNLRRHKKCHRNPTDNASPEDHTSQ